MSEISTTVYIRCPAMYMYVVVDVSVTHSGSPVIMVGLSLNGLVLIGECCTQLIALGT